MPFKVHEHVVPCQHIRELPNALSVDESHPDATLHLHVKQYVPIDYESQPGDITIIALHANTFHKECYEPLWDDLLSQLPSEVRIRAIWMADIAQQGESYVLNESKLADGVSWDDHARDMLFMVNQFRDQMPPPLVGVGHSMGGAQLVSLSKLHPRLFHSVAFLDGCFWADRPHSDQAWENHKINWSRSVGRKDRFQSREAVTKAYAKSPFFSSWDRRVLDIYLQTAFRDLPTLMHNDSDEGVALKTPAAMETFTTARPNLEGLNADPEVASRLDRIQYPDMGYYLPYKVPYFLTAPRTAGEHVAHLRPRALFLYGKKGSITFEGDRKYNLEHAGTMSGGSGGQKLGAVEEDYIEGTHFFPFENPAGTAERLGGWLTGTSNVWREEKAQLEERFGGKAKVARDKQVLKPEFFEACKKWKAERSSKL